MDKWDPFPLRERINKLFDVSQSGRGIADQPAWLPVVDIYETPEDFTVKAELPEVSESDISIKVEGNTLKLSGERRFRCEGRNYYQVERAYGAFSRSFLLPADVDQDRIRATLSDGVLRIVVPKKTKDIPRQIEIK